MVPGDGRTANWSRVLFRVMKIFYNYTVMLVVQLCEYSKSHEIVHFKG